MTSTALYPSPPRSVERALTLIAIAVTAGAVEAVLRTALELDRADADAGSLAAGLGVRTAAYGVVVAVGVFMYRGRRWARNALTLGLSTFGLGSLIAEPLAATLSANGFGDLLHGATVESTLLAAIRILHIAAVVAALVAMQRGDARAYFSTRPSDQTTSRRCTSHTVPTANTAR